MKKNKIAPEIAPTEKEIIFCISLYFGIPKKFGRSHFTFKMYLKEIAEKRFFVQKIKDHTERELFKIYLSTMRTKRQISLEVTNKTTIGVYIINRNLKRLVCEIMQDYENGILQVQEYQKPPTKRQNAKRINEYLQKIGISDRVPLRKKSKKELLKDWEKFSSELEAKTNELEKLK